VSQAISVPHLPASPSPFVVRDAEFEAVLGHAPRLAHVIDVDGHEGPVHVPADDALYFTTVPRQPGPSVDIKRLSLESMTTSTVRRGAAAANGMALSRDGRLVVCEQLGGAIASVDRRTGGREVLAEGFNSPNDVVVRSDGTIWFTDPSYGWLQGFRPRPLLRDAVWRYDPRTGSSIAVADSFDKPNGLCFSPDERTLYVADNGEPHHLKAFDVLDGGRLDRERVIHVVSAEHPDGLKADSAGRLYATFAGGVEVLSPDGSLLGQIELPGAVNFCFGGPDRNVLFITTDTAIYAAQLQAKGP
jgi:gluconolactonase